MKKHSGISSPKKLIIKMVSICIVAFYLLLPFGNHITLIIHQSTHLAMSMIQNSESHHHHTSLFVSEGNNFLQSVDELTADHSHPVINLLNAAFDFQESLPDSQKKVNTTLDLHLISSEGQIPNPGISATLQQSVFPPESVNPLYYDGLTPPPRQFFSQV